MHTSFRLNLLTLGSMALLGATSPSQAQTPPATPVQNLPTVSVSASADASAEGLAKPYAGGQVARGARLGVLGTEDIMDSPFSTLSFTQELIKNQQAASVGDVLQNDPAVRLTRGFGNYQQVYMIRGLPVFSDDMSYNGLYGLLPRQYLATEFLERVEVLRGASAFINGAAPGGSGLGGAVNVVPKRAPNEPLNDITLGVENGGQKYIAADLARRFGPDQSTGVRLNAAHRDGGTSVDGEHRELSLVALGLDWRSRNLRLSADIGYQDHKLRASMPSITFAPGVPIGPVPDASRSISQPWAYSNEKDTFGTFRAEYDITPTITTWVAAGGRYGEEANSLPQPTVSAVDGTASENRFDNVRKEAIATGEAGIRGKFQTGSVGHTVVASVATFNQKAKNAYEFYGTPIVNNIYNPVASAPPTTFFPGGGSMTDPLVTARTKTSSVAISDTLAFMDDTVLVTLGARHQKIESYSYDYATGIDNGSYSASRVTPVAGVVFKASKEVSVYATYIEGLVKGDNAPASTASQPVGNAGQVFKPYQSKQTELGVKLDTGRLGGTLSVFETRKPVYSVDTTTNVFGQTGEQRNRGVELSAFGEPIRGFRVLGGMTFLDTDVAGNDAIGAPKTQFTLGAEWDVPGIRNLTLNGRVVQTSKQYADAANLQQVPSWARLDVGARYIVDLGNQQVTIRARIDNLLDRNYWASAGGYPGAGYLTVGAPRTFVLSGSINF